MVLDTEDLSDEFVDSLIHYLTPYIDQLLKSLMVGIFRDQCGVTGVEHRMDLIGDVTHWI